VFLRVPLCVFRLFDQRLLLRIGYLFDFVGQFSWGKRLLEKNLGDFRQILDEPRRPRFRQYWRRRQHILDWRAAGEDRWGALLAKGLRLCQRKRHERRPRPGGPRGRKRPSPNGFGFHDSRSKGGESAYSQNAAETVACAPYRIFILVLPRLCVPL
jgi:hypothetical protein